MKVKGKKKQIQFSIHYEENEKHFRTTPVKTITFENKSFRKRNS